MTIATKGNQKSAAHTTRALRPKARTLRIFDRTSSSRGSAEAEAFTGVPHLCVRGTDGWRIL